MPWVIEYYSEEVRLEIDALPVGIRASYARLTELIEEFGLDLACLIHVQWEEDCSNYGREGRKESPGYHRSGSLTLPAAGKRRYRNHDWKNILKDAPPDG